MNIDTMTLDEIDLELKRAKFWIDINPISKSLRLINKMENKKLELINKKLGL
jgi:hypothetical protein